MKRRSFLTLLGLSPVVAKAAPSEPELTRDGSFVGERAESDWEFIEFVCDGKVLGSVSLNGTGAPSYNTAPRTREGNGG